jgi:hypothetical protein
MSEKRERQRNKQDKVRDAMIKGRERIDEAARRNKAQRRQYRPSRRDYFAARIATGLASKLEDPKVLALGVWKTVDAILAADPEEG